MSNTASPRGGIFQFRVMELQDVPRFVERLSADKEVHAPQRKGKAFVFALLENAADVCLDYDVTLLPPKKYFLPPKETLVHFTMGPTITVDAKVESRDLVLFGVHPYDIQGLNVLDTVFTEKHPDPNYLDKRNKAVIIGLAPQRISPYAFAGQMDSVRVRRGFDLFFSLVDGHYVVAVATDRGLALLDAYGTTRPAGQTDVEMYHAAEDEVVRKLTNWSARFTQAELPALLKASMKHAVWEKKAEKCFSCGSCNLVCPTCYCFDVQEDVAMTLLEGERYRMWDGCLLEPFAAVAGGENFREHRKDRYRHRLLRKGQFMAEKHEMPGCVGCGRCSTVCLPDIANPIEVFNALKEEH